MSIKKTAEEIAEEIKDKYSYYIGDSLSDFEMVSGRDVILPGDIIPMLTNAMNTYADQWQQPQSGWISEKEQMIEVFKWLLGYYDFPEPPKEGRPKYYWRNDLRGKLKEIGIDIDNPPVTGFPLPSPPIDK